MPSILGVEFNIEWIYTSENIIKIPNVQYYESNLPSNVLSFPSRLCSIGPLCCPCITARLMTSSQDSGPGGTSGWRRDISGATRRENKVLKRLGTNKYVKMKASLNR